MSIIAGLVVSADAFFIGLSLGLQKKCKFLYLAIINVFLFILCILGFLMAGWLYELIPFEPDYVVGFSFILLGLWCILHYFLSIHNKQHNNKATLSEGSVAEASPAEQRGLGQSPINKEKPLIKTIILVGLVMSGEAMLITMGITFLFLHSSTFLIPITVALAHFGYSTISFYLARTKHVNRIPVALSHIISGVALIIYGLMALFVEFGDMIL